MTTETTDAKKPGRPKGAKTQPRETVPAALSRCPRCQSTDRGPYTFARRVPHSGWTPEGEPFSEVVFRTTRCASCGQARIDRSYEFRPDSGPDPGNK